LWNAKLVLKEGLLWRIDDGSQVKIWGDCWIPSTRSHKIQTPIRFLHGDARVSELINLETNW